MERISPTGDLAFKKVLASEENKDILSGLIKDFFEVEVDELTIESPYNIAAYKEVVKDEEVKVLRQTISDVAATFKTADFVSEMQVKKSWFFEERSLLYPLERFCRNYNRAGHMITDAMGRPIRYSSLRPVYSLNILGSSHFDDEDALRILELYDPVRHKHFKRLLRIGFFELAKPNIETTNQQYWRDYFNTGEVAPEAPDYIKKASSIIELANLTEEERTVARTIERAQAMYDADMYGSYIEGEEKGVVKGKAEEKIEVAKGMLADGLSPEKIAKYTGLTIGQIKSLTVKQ